MSRTYRNNYFKETKNKESYVKENLYRFYNIQKNCYEKRVRTKRSVAEIRAEQSNLDNQFEESKKYYSFDTKKNMYYTVYVSVIDGRRIRRYLHRKIAGRYKYVYTKISEQEAKRILSKEYDRYVRDGTARTHGNHSKFFKRKSSKKIRRMEVPNKKEVYNDW
jgi:hypothetical protein